MQTTTSPQERIAFWKDVKRQLIQQHVDIERLWKLAGDATSEGVPFGGNGTITVTTTTTTSTSSTSSTTTVGPCQTFCYRAVISGITGTGVSNLNGTWDFYDRFLHIPPSCFVDTFRYHGAVPLNTITCTGTGSGNVAKWAAGPSSMADGGGQFSFDKTSGVWGDSTLVYTKNVVPGCAGGVPNTITLTRITCT